VPTGRVARKKFNKQLLLVSAIWPTVANSFIGEEFPLTFPVSSSVTDFVLKLKSVCQFTGRVYQPFLVESCLVEDSIIGKKTAPVEIFDYLCMCCAPSFNRKMAQMC